MPGENSATKEREELIKQVESVTDLHPDFLRIIGCKADQSIVKEERQNILSLKAMLEMVECLTSQGNTANEKLEKFVIAFAELELIVANKDVTGPIKGQMLARFLDKVNPELAQAKSGVMTDEQLKADEKTIDLLYLMDRAGEAIGRYLNLGEYAKGTRSRGTLSNLSPEDAEKKVKENLIHRRSVGMWKILSSMVTINRKAIEGDLVTAFEKYHESLNYLAGDYKDALKKKLDKPLRKQDEGNWVQTAALGVGAYGSGAGEGEKMDGKPIHDSLQAAVQNVIDSLNLTGPNAITNALTRSEIAALVAYTSQLYANINTGLRVGGGVTSTNLQRWTALAVSGLLKLPSMNGTSYRHDSIKPHVLSRLSQKTFTDLTFFSSAVTIDGTAGGQNHEMLSVLKFNRGFDVSPLSYYGEAEAEVLFPPNTRWRIDNIYRRADFAFDERGIPIPWVHAPHLKTFTDTNCYLHDNWTPYLPVDIELLMKDPKHGNRGKVQVIVVAIQL